MTFPATGVNPAPPIRGMALNEGRDVIRRARKINVVPGRATIRTVVATNLDGTGQGKALDVKGSGDAGWPRAGYTSSARSAWPVRGCRFGSGR